jgi:hypothetical protein
VSTALWSLVWVLVGLLMIFTVYAAVIGLAGVFAGSRYEHCPRCGHHYLAGPGQAAHECPHGVEERLFQAGRALLHHSAGGPGSGEFADRPANQASNRVDSSIE